MSTPDFTGPGYFAGEPPNGLTTVAQVPVAAQVRVYWRDPDDDAAPDVLVASTDSAADGTWQITGINPELQYVIQGIKAGYNDVSINGCVPARTDEITIVSEHATPAGAASSVFVIEALIVGGLPPYTMAADGNPADVSVSLQNVREIVAAGAGLDAVWGARLQIESANALTRAVYLWGATTVLEYEAAEWIFTMSDGDYTPPDGSNVVFIF